VQGVLPGTPAAQFQHIQAKTYKSEKVMMFTSYIHIVSSGIFMLCYLLPLLPSFSREVTAEVLQTCTNSTSTIQLSPTVVY